MKISFHQSHLSSKKFNLFRNPSLFFLKMSLSYKHIKIITQLKISIQKSNNKHIFVVKFKHMDISNFNNLKKKSTNCPFTEKDHKINKCRKHGFQSFPTVHWEKKIKMKQLTLNYDWFAKKYIQYLSCNLINNDLDLYSL